MTKCLDFINRLVWGVPALVLILGVGLYLTVRLGFVQFTLLPRAIGKFFRMLRPRGKGGESSPFQALCTALAATVGTGNMVGVAGAICLGGPGSIFWMWICALLGMATKYAEAVLAVQYRVRQGGEYVGGPMYILSRGLHMPRLGRVYAAFGILAAFGVGNATQINAVVTAVNTVTGRESLWGNLVMGAVLAALTGGMLLGGAGRIGKAAESLVPLASAAYILLCAGVLAAKWQQIPGAFRAIVQGAFTPAAVTGGMLGSAYRALRVGCARGVFTNEAGMGTAAIAHAAAQVEHPGEQGLMGIMEVFLDTIVICTMTALAILCSGVPIPYGRDVGGALTTAAFSVVYGDWAGALLAAALCCFAFATVLGWSLYGGRCAQYLFGQAAWRPFAVLQTAMVLLGAAAENGALWTFSEAVNGAMAIPNLIALAALTPEVRRLTIDYKKSGSRPEEVENADFH